MNRIELSIVVPALDEETAIASVVADHARAAAELSQRFELIVCDDGSSDSTWDVLQRCARSHHQLRLLRHAMNLGIPTTMQELYAAAAGEWTYFTPGDWQVPAEALRIMWSRRDGLSALVGRRHPRRDHVARLAQAYAYSRLVRSLFGIGIRDIDGVKLYRTADARRHRHASRSVFFEAELLIRMSRDGLRIGEVDVPHRPRRGGRAKAVTLGTTAAALRDVALFALRHPRGRTTVQDPAPGANS